MNVFNLNNNNNHNVSMVTGKDAICINRIPTDGLYDSILVSLFDDLGHKYESKPINKTQNSFVIQMRNMRPGRYYMTCFKRGFAFEPYSLWFDSIPILIGRDRIVTFEQSPVYESNVKCFRQIVRQSSNKIVAHNPRSEKIKQVTNRITQNCSTEYDVALAVHDYIAQTISYDMDAYNKILNNENFDYKKVCDASMVLDSGLGVCVGFSNLAVAMFTSIGISAKTLSCYALGQSTEGKWSRKNVQSGSNHVITAVYVINRWVLMDITWDAANDYQNGSIKKKRSFCRVYFDPTFQFLSCTHKLLLN